MKAHEAPHTRANTNAGLDPRQATDTLVAKPRARRLTSLCS